ncbi:hypothetical protein SEA_ROSMARINUS_60 [Mycobacterium Phage Rosmarinus]|uniref:Uncharacterized protein n=1 Tax=Mycobacterium phage Adephagia TaxID=1034127 RepID=G1BPR4_9CAUD|nr:hypothetical protein I5G89_gp40 [Mycobacterium phage Adephagia]APU93164.1 hypothetical protein SEA_CREW_60 [Mycobacterium phage CREW]ASR86893.1 hypothetical protein SEA_JECKYLL_60 [Mycobacterium phage Jeckyll]ASR87706.1 hypothetical protein SEA_TACHEZ_60 [Mycobacterium phage Tachez]AXH47090.1 hypothetical protein SEA_BEEST_60 [Mycobacterium phage BEEST]AXH50122.1 hypothetical protein SEA_JOY99_60 [Mycobacterium phage Joy99]AXQ51577.1 hypothetical protein SEA_BELLADONNA_60 [Mycobacterium ph
MRVSFALTVLGCHLGTLDVEVDGDDETTAPAAPVKAATKPVKWASRLWVKGMMA